MKKLTVVLVAIAFMAFLASAALAQGMMEKMSFGIKGGVNLAKPWGDDVPDDAKWRLGANIGAFMSYQFHDMFAIQPEVYYAMKGWKEEFGDTTFTAKMDYVDIVVLGKLLIPMEGMVQPCLFVGPCLGINIKKDYEVDPVPPGVEGEGELEEIKSTDFGAVLGASLDIEISEGYMLLLDIRYNMGLTTIHDPDEGDASDVKNQAITFMAGIAF